MHLTKDECKNEVARSNNFDSFERAIRYTFSRELLQSEKDFLNKIVDESMQKYADQEAKKRLSLVDNPDYLQGIIDGYGGEEPLDELPHGFKDINEVWDKLAKLKQDEK